MPFCQFCGSQVAHTDKFCCVCGKPTLYRSSINTVSPESTGTQISYGNTPGNPPIFGQSTNPGIDQNQNHLYPKYSYSQPTQKESSYSSSPQQNFVNIEENKKWDTPNNSCSEINTFVQKIDNPFDRQVFDVLKAKGWLDSEQKSNEAIMCMADELPFMYIVKDSLNQTPEQFVLLVTIDYFKDKDFDRLLKLCQEWNSYFLTSKVYLDSPYLKKDTLQNKIFIIYAIDRRLVTDIDKTLEVALEDLVPLLQEVINKK